MSEWLFAGPSDGCADNRDLDEPAVATLEQNFRRMPLTDYPFWPVPDGLPGRWFEGHGAILRDDAGRWLWVRAQSPERLAAVRQLLPGDWLM